MHKRRGRRIVAPSSFLQCAARRAHRPGRERSHHRCMALRTCTFRGGAVDGDPRCLPERPEAQAAVCGYAEAYVLAHSDRDLVQDRGAAGAQARELTVPGVVVEATRPGAWRPHWAALFTHLHGSVPADWAVPVLTDRGLDARWLFQHLVTQGWHPFLRRNLGGNVRPTRAATFRPLATVAPH